MVGGGDPRASRCANQIGHAFRWQIESAAMKALCKIQQYLLTLFAVLLLYVGSYCCLSANGEYYFAESDRFHYQIYGMAVGDINIWHHKFLHWEPCTDFFGEKTTRGNLLGYVYCPMIVLDRGLVHSTKPNTDPATRPPTVGVLDLR